MTLKTSDGWNEGAASITLELKSPYDLWRESHFTMEELTDPTISETVADPNGNNLSNGFEYVFGRDPQLPDFTPGWTSSLASLPGNDGLVMRFTFSRQAQLPEGMVLTVGGSLDLTPSSWNPIATKSGNNPWNAPAVNVTETDLPDGRIQVHVDAPLESGLRFFRLEADL